MEDKFWSFFSDSTFSRTYQFKPRSGNYYFDYEFDDLKAEYPCPFCSEDFDLLGLCCHIDDEHSVDAKSGVCPVCATRVRNMVGHIMMQHGDIIKILKLYQDDSHSTLSFTRKELRDERMESLVAGLSSAVSTSKIEPDPFLSFVYKAPTTDKSKRVQPDSLTELNLEEKSLGDALLDRDAQLSFISDMDITEKTKRSDFVQELLLSTILDESLCPVRSSC